MGKNLIKTAKAGVINGVLLSILIVSLCTFMNIQYGGLLLALEISAIAVIFFYKTVLVSVLLKKEIGENIPKKRIIVLSTLIYTLGFKLITICIFGFFNNLFNKMSGQYVINDFPDYNIYIQTLKEPKYIVIMVLSFLATINIFKKLIKITDKPVKTRKTKEKFIQSEPVMPKIVLDPSKAVPSNVLSYHDKKEQEKEKTVTPTKNIRSTSPNKNIITNKSRTTSSTTAISKDKKKVKRRARF